jgi:hypothetical protein
MTKFLKVFYVMALSAFLMSCKTVKIEDGKIPSEYMSEAKKLEGVYAGRFDGIKGEVTLRMNGNRAELSFQGEKGSDILAGCGSTIGDLVEISISGNSAKDYRLSQAVFSFSPGSCRRYVGRNLYLDFSRDQATFRLGYITRYESRWECRYEGGGGYPPNPPREICTFNEYPVFMGGYFKKK